MPGYVATYVHGEGVASAAVVLRFRERTSSRLPEFQVLARELGMQVVAMKPLVVAPSDLNEDAWLQELSRLRGSSALPSAAADRMAWLQAARSRYERDFCLLKQPFIKDGALTVEERIAQVNSGLSESIAVVRFSLCEAREAE